jgi:transcriptional regulator with GAF, ATPase, and Fis domain
MASLSPIDLTHDLAAVADMGTTVAQVNELLGQSIDTLGQLVPFELATIMELVAPDELRVRVARGSLVTPRLLQHRLSLRDRPALRGLLSANRARAMVALDHETEGDAFDGVLDLPHGHACMVVPLFGRDGPVGLMTFDRSSCGIYPPEIVAVASVFGKLLGMALTYGAQSALLARLHEQLLEQNRLLQESAEGGGDATALIARCKSPAMVEVVHMARQVAQTDTPVLITGETGTGKEVLAHAVHGWSRRQNRTIVSLNCAALPPSLIESELFGHVKGAFSGATKNRMGRFAAANGGTLFLDEIGELPLELQPKFLRALQEGCFEPVGSDSTVRVDVRIIAATNVDLLNAVAERRFREDLYYRLAVFPIHLPPLRARREDILVIAESFLAKLARRTGNTPWHLSDASVEWLQRQPWRGNVRELINTLERATILSSGSLLEVGGPPPALAASAPSVASRPLSPQERDGFLTLEQMERQHIQRALVVTGGKLYGPGGSAELLGINPNTLRSRMKKLGLGGARQHRGRSESGVN